MATFWPTATSGGSVATGGWAKKFRLFGGAISKKIFLGLTNMTVKFEFVLSDVDATNLMDILQSAKTKALVEAGKCLIMNNQSGANWYNSHADYIEEIKQKVLAGNTRVE